MQIVAPVRRLPVWITAPLMAFLITRVVVFAGAYLADAILPSIANDDARGVLNVWDRWDSVWYTRIAEEGYSYTPGIKSPVVFFPLYPLALHVMSPFTNGALAAGLLLSNLCFLFALVLLYRLTELLLASRLDAGRTIFYIAAFPTAFFFSAAYTESLFLLLSVGAAYFAKRRQWGWAALFGILCSAARPLGILIILIVLFEWLAAHGWNLSHANYAETWRNIQYAFQSDWRSLLLIALIPLGLLLYMAYLAGTFGDAFLFLKAQADWDFGGLNGPGPVAVIIRDVGQLINGQMPIYNGLNILAFLAVVGLTIPIGRQLGAGYALYSILSVLIPMFSRSGSMVRFVVVLFPAFMVMGHWGRKAWFDRPLRILFLPFLGMFTALFVKGVFIG